MTLEQMISHPRFLEMRITTAATGAGKRSVLVTFDTHEGPKVLGVAYDAASKLQAGVAVRAVLHGFAEHVR